jgi:hypothetical protein
LLSLQLDRYFAISTAVQVFCYGQGFCYPYNWTGILQSLQLDRFFAISRAGQEFRNLYSFTGILLSTQLDRSFSISTAGQEFCNPYSWTGTVYCSLQLVGDFAIHTGDKYFAAAQANSSSSYSIAMQKKTILKEQCPENFLRDRPVKVPMKAVCLLQAF